MDNGHGPVAHSAQVPPYLTLFVTLKLGIMIVLLINLTSQLKRKDQVLVMHQPIVHRTSNFYYASCPFSACMLTTSAGSLDSLPLDTNNVILDNSS